MFQNQNRSLKTLKNKLVKMSPRNLKSIIISVIASVLIGCIFGFVSLKMAVQDDTDAGAINSSVQTAREDTSNDFELDGLSFFVVQGGVFEEAENAKDWQKDFKDKGYNSINWNRDDVIYLLAGVGADQSTTKTLAKKMEKDGFDVYTKEWEIPGATLTGTDIDKAYLEDFQESWKQAIEQEDIAPFDQWSHQGEGISERIQPLQDKLDSLKNEKDIETQTFLLELAKSYEKLLNK